MRHGDRDCLPTTRRLLSVIRGGLFVLACVPASGQSQEAGSENDNGLNFRVRNEISYDDNILNIRDSVLSSRIWEIAPDANFTLTRGGKKLDVNAGFIHRNYLDSSADTYTSRRAAVSYEQWMSEVFRVRLDGSLENLYEQRGNGVNEGQNALSLPGPTPLDISQLAMGLQLGREQAKMRFNADFMQRDTDRQSPIITNDSTDNSETMAVLAAKYRLGRRTDLVAEKRIRDFHYPNFTLNADGSLSSRDSREEIVIVGMDVAATGATGGKVRIGKIDRKFSWKSAYWDDEVPVTPDIDQTSTAAPGVITPFEDSQDLFWEVVAIWDIKSYSRLELTTQSSTREALAVGSYIRSRDVTLRWTHLWSERLQSIIDFTFGEDVYKGTERIDDRTVYNLRLEYEFDDWLRMGLGFRHQNLDSPFSIVGYDKDIYYIFATYSKGYGD